MTARRFYYDHLTFDPALLRLIVEVYGASQILVGSDYPFYPASGVHPHADFEHAGLSRDMVSAICCGNARRFLKLD